MVARRLRRQDSNQGLGVQLGGRLESTSCRIPARSLPFLSGCARRVAPFALETSVSSGSTAVDVEDLARNERGALQIEDSVDDVADLADPTKGWTSAKPSYDAGSCVGVLITPGATALTRTPRDAYSMASERVTARAGLTERTFFRYFADKREVLFEGAGALQELLVSAVADAPAALAPIDAVAAALRTAGPMFAERREFARQRQRIIAANAELQERELIKLASLAAAIADALRRRGVGDPAADLTAEAGIAIFKITFERWADEDNRQDFGRLVQESLVELKAVTAGE
jgi:AcrR family transcriptional regulator